MRFFKPVSGATIGLSASLCAAAALLASCTDADNRVLTAACIKAAHSGGATVNDASMQSRCECASAEAKKNLDPDDYHLLVRLADIYSVNAPDDVKFEKLMTTMSGWGISTAKASAAAIDIMFLAHRVAAECPSQSASAEQDRSGTAQEQS